MKPRKLNEGEMVYGKTLRTQRKKIGITQAELGRMVGKSKQWVSEFERGNIRLNMDIAVQLSAALDVTPDIFLPRRSKKIGQNVLAARGSPQ